MFNTISSVLSFRLLFLLLFVFVVGCRVQQPLSTFSWEAFETELLQKSKMDRLVALHTGVFMLCDSLGNTIQVAGNDSILIWAKATGDPNRDGYWIYQEQVMYNFPEEPLSADFIKFVKIDEDTVRNFLGGIPDDEGVAPEVKKISGKGAFFRPELLQNIALKTMPLRQDDCAMSLLKTEQLEFKGETEMCFSEYTNIRQVITMNISPRMQQLSFRVWDLSTDSLITDDTQYYKRLDEVAFRKQYPHYK